jgi:hypothetical protein
VLARAADRRQRCTGSAPRSTSSTARGIRRPRHQGRHPTPEPRRRVPRHHLAPGPGASRGRPHRNEG